MLLSKGFPPSHLHGLWWHLHWNEVSWSRMFWGSSKYEMQLHVITFVCQPKPGKDVSIAHTEVFYTGVTFTTGLFLLDSSGNRGTETVGLNVIRYADAAEPWMCFSPTDNSISLKLQIISALSLHYYYFPVLLPLLFKGKLQKPWWTVLDSWFLKAWIWLKYAADKTHWWEQLNDIC